MISSMTATQPGKRRREGVVEPPDLKGLYPTQRSVKRRRIGVVKPPVVEQLQLPKHDSALNSSCEKKNEDGPLELIAAAVDKEETSNGAHKPIASKDQDAE